MLMACQKSEQKEESAQLDLATQSSGIYRAYPVQSDSILTPPCGGGAGGGSFYISGYFRHGSRYQPSDKRYANTLQRLQEGHARGVLTAEGEALLPQIQTLCDSCLGHGGQLTSVGERQLEAIGGRLAQRYPEVFEGKRFVSARASVVPRCGASMRAFMRGLEQQLGHPTNSLLEVDSAYMNYIAYDSPAMRELSADTAFWRDDFNRYYRLHTLQQSVVERFFTDATDVDSLNFVDDLYWLTIGMQNVDVPGCDLSGCFTPEELFECYRCVNYRMYICNSLSPTGQGIPARSASSLLKNIVEGIDDAIIDPNIAAHLRFGHDSNLLRLLSLMRVAGTTAEVENPAEAYDAWREAEICPMGANLQLVLSRSDEGKVYLQFFHNEQLTTLDVPELQPAEGGYYLWNDVRSYFLSQIDTANNEETDFIEPVQ